METRDTTTEAPDLEGIPPDPAMAYASGYCAGTRDMIWFGAMLVTCAILLYIGLGDLRY
jgi:hypothetical protein